MNQFIGKMIEHNINIYLSFVYNLRIAGQTGGPNGLTFFVDPHGWPGGDKGKKIVFFKFPRATPGPSALVYNKH